MKLMRKLAFIMGGFLLLLSLAGCQLAREDEGEGGSGYGDRLVGLFITTEYLDLFDMEGYIKGHLPSSGLGGEMTVGNDRGKYEDRLYAVKTTTSHTDAHTGETLERSEYRFPDANGFNFFAPITYIAYKDIMDGEAIEYSVPTTDSMVDPPVYSSGMHVNVGDEQFSIELEGNIYIGSLKKEITLHLNPVYQNEAGEVFLQSGYSAMMITPENTENEGEIQGSTIAGESTITDGEKIKSYSGKFNMNIHIAHVPEKAVLVQMDEENKVLSRIEYKTEELPETIRPEKNTAYIIAESHRKDKDGRYIITREVYSPESESGIKVFVPWKEGIEGFLETHYVNINWDGGESM